jgi:hypothetical protein
MAVLGVRCSNTDYAYCVLSGTRDAPSVEAAELILFPKGFSEPELLKWLHQEMAKVFNSHECGAVGIKKPEVPVKRSNSLETRIQCEAIVSLAAAEAGCLSVQRLVKASIAKRLGLKGKANYLRTQLDTTPIDGFDDYTLKVQEAILVGWSCM